MTRYLSCMCNVTISLFVSLYSIIYLENNEQFSIKVLSICSLETRKMFRYSLIFKLQAYMLLWNGSYVNLVLCHENPINFCSFEWLSLVTDYRLYYLLL